MSSRENISSDDLHALLHQLQASNASAVDHYGMTLQEIKAKALQEIKDKAKKMKDKALQEIKDKATKAHARLVG